MNRLNLERIFQRFLFCIFVLYLIFDIYHYLTVRIEELYPSWLTEAVYESHSISYTKWCICTLGIVSLTIRKNGNISLCMLWIVSLSLLLIFFLKGRFTTLMTGSLFFDIYILELTALLSFIYTSVALLRNRIFLKRRLLFLAISMLLVFYFVVSQLSSFIMFE